VVPVFMQAATLDLTGIVRYQGEHAWLALCQPVSFFIFLVSAFAETNRLPFDLPEANRTGGRYHTEYSGMKFAMFFLGNTPTCLSVRR